MHEALPWSIQKPGTLWTALPSLVLAPVALFVPSSIARVDLAKLALLGTLVTTFFLFTGKTMFPGGAGQFIDYADAIIHGTALPPSVAQRDAGYPLLIILSGYLLLHSLILIFLIQAAFAIVLPLLIYTGLRRLSPSLAFYTGLASIVTLSPFYFMKMIHHDQTYIFFSMLTVCPLLIFVQTKQVRFLYFFTLAAICASIARPAGNALFPIFLVASYIAARGSIRHYLVCSLVFGLFLVGYARHRYIIFDMKDVHTTASYTGEQIFYAPYLNSSDYGIRLVPNMIGPDFALAVENLRNRLQPAPKDSKYILDEYIGSDIGAAQFAKANIIPFTTDELIDRVLTHANWEYYVLLCGASDDRIMLRATLEIARTHPGLILEYFTRNLLHFIFDPGYKHSRYNTYPFGPEGLFFVPAIGAVVPEAQSLPPRAFRELSVDSFSLQQPSARRLFEAVQSAWLQYYKDSVAILGALMCIAWLTALLELAIFMGRWLTTSASTESKLEKSFTIAGGLVASIVIASLLFGYNAAVTSLFAEPEFRYREMTDLQAILIAGLGLVSIQHWLRIALDRSFTPYLAKHWSAAVSSMRSLDVWQRLTALQLAILVVGVAFAGFAWWTLFILKNVAV